MAVSPDGTSVYVTSTGTLTDGNAIIHFGRALNGALTFDSCISNASTSAANGCTSVGSEVLDSAFGVAVNPDGASVYVVSPGFNQGEGHAIIHFSRALNGDLTFDSCISSASTSAVNGCTSVGSEVLGGSIAVAVSPDGASVYVASDDSWAISHFSRALNGDLTFSACISNASTSAANGCTSVGSEVLAIVDEVAVARTA